MRNHDEKFLMKELGIEIGADMHIPLRDYLIFGSTFSIMLLSNRSVKGGQVKISPHEINVILKEAIRHKISDGLPIRESLINEDIKKRLKPSLMEILSEISLRSPALGRQSQDLAPCMERVIEELRSGGKVPHLKRWALAVFLVKRGWDIDKIVEVFSHAPNYDEKIVRYQLDHVRAKGYLMPSCRNLITQGICVAECGIKNPLQFRKENLAKTKPVAKSNEEKQGKEQSKEE
jgi:DNA primase large subunit